MDFKLGPDLRHFLRHLRQATVIYRPIPLSEEKAQLIQSLEKLLSSPGQTLRNLDRIQRQPTVLIIIHCKKAADIRHVGLSR